MNKLFRSKKGNEAYVITQKTYFYMILMVIIFATFFTTIYFVNKNYSTRITIEDSIKADFALARVTNVCFAYVNPQTSQVEQNVLDHRKLTNENLRNCFISEKEDAFEISIVPIIKGDFQRKDLKIGNSHISRKGFTRYTLVKLDNGEIKPGLIAYVE